MTRRTLLTVAFLLVAAPARAQWSASGAPVCIAANTQQNVRVAPDGAGGAIIVWDDARGADAAVYAQRLNAAGVPQWTVNGVLVSTLSSRARVVSDGAGGAIVVWGDSRPGGIGIYGQRLNSLGAKQWLASGVQLSTTFGEPELDADGAGGAVLAWSAGVQPTRDIYAQRVSGAGGVLWTAGGLAVCRHPQDQEQVAIAATGGGAAVIAWLDHRAGSSRDFARAVGAAGDTLWTPLGNALSPTNPAAMPPAVAADGAGGAYIAVADQRVGGQGTHLYAHRLNAAGAPPAGWNANGIDLGGTYSPDTPKLVIVRDAGGGAILGQLGGHVSHVTAGGTGDWVVDVVQINGPWDPAYGVQLVAHPGGGAIVGWHDIRTQNDYDVWDTQVLSDGQLSQGCVKLGESLCNGTGSQTDLRGVSDGAGGAIFAWRDARADGGNVYANHTTCAALVGVGGSSLAGPQLRLAPNPSFGARRALVTLVGDEPATLTLHDLAGRVVARPTLMRTAGGTAVVELDPEGHLPVGTYFLKLRQGEHTAVVKATWLR